MVNATKEAFDQGYQGVVVTHGTDTLHLSAAAMSYAWSGKGGRAPGRIVFTGSQRSPDGARATPTRTSSQRSHGRPMDLTLPGTGIPQSS